MREEQEGKIHDHQSLMDLTSAGPQVSSLHFKAIHPAVAVRRPTDPSSQNISAAPAQLKLSFIIVPIKPQPCVWSCSVIGVWLCFSKVNCCRGVIASGAAAPADPRLVRYRTHLSCTGAKFSKPPLCSLEP